MGMGHLVDLSAWGAGRQLCGVQRFGALGMGVWGIIEYSRPRREELAAHSILKFAKHFYTCVTTPLSNAEREPEGAVIRV